MRTFVAVAIPEKVKEAVGRVPSRLERAGFQLRWVRPAGYHLTLKFLGEIEEADADRAAALLDEGLVGEGPFRCSVQGVGVFPDLRRPRVVWVGVQEGAEHLVRLAKKVDRAMRRLGVEKERRPYSAHLTIGRSRGKLDGRRLGEELAKLEGFEAGSFEVGAVHLIRSDLRPEGAIYTDLHTVRLEEERG